MPDFRPLTGLYRRYLNNLPLANAQIRVKLSVNTYNLEAGYPALEQIITTTETGHIPNGTTILKTARCFDGAKAVFIEPDGFKWEAVVPDDDAPISIQELRANGTILTPPDTILALIKATNLGELNNVDFVNLTDGDAVTWDALSGKFVNRPIEPGAQMLNNLNDVAITSPTFGSFVQFISGYWVNRSAAQVKTSLGIPATTDGLNEGADNQYFTSERTLNVLLSGITFLSTLPVLATDTVKAAFGKLQAQLNRVLSIFTFSNPVFPSLKLSAQACTFFGIDFLPGQILESAAYGLVIVPVVGDGQELTPESSVTTLDYITFNDDANRAIRYNWSFLDHSRFDLLKLYRVKKVSRTTTYAYLTTVSAGANLFTDDGSIAGVVRNLSTEPFSELGRGGDILVHRPNNPGLSSVVQATFDGYDLAVQAGQDVNDLRATALTAESGITLLSRSVIYCADSYPIMHTLFTCPENKRAIILNVVSHSPSENVGNDDDIFLGSDANAEDYSDGSSLRVTFDGKAHALPIVQGNSVTVLNDGDTFKCYFSKGGNIGTITVDVFGYLMDALPDTGGGGVVVTPPDSNTD